MRFRAQAGSVTRKALCRRIAVWAIVWLALIGGLHFWLNTAHDMRKVVKMGYMPVVTNLAAPILDHATQSGDGIYFQAVKFASFAEMAEALRNGQIQAAFMIAPLAIVLSQQGEDVRVVSIGNRHESTLVARKELNIKRFEDLAGRTVAVPMRFSGHHLSLLKLMAEKKMKKTIRIVEMNPPDMAAALAAGSLDAYCVGEPFAAQAVKSGDATVVHYVEDVWKNFICNLVVVRQAFIQSDPEAVGMLVQGAARAGIWAGKHSAEAARVAAQYWKQPLGLVEYVLSFPKGRIVYDRFLPRQDEMQYLADLMVRFGLIEHNKIAGLVEDRFAGSVQVADIDDLDSVLRPLLSAHRP